MNILFIHQNFPGQFRHVASKLAENKHHNVVALGDAAFVNPKRPLHPKIVTYAYKSPDKGNQRTHPYIREYEGQVRRAQQVVRAINTLKAKGYSPDVVVVHNGWGEGLLVKEALPDSRIIQYCEFYYRASGADVGFDPEFPASDTEPYRVKLRNSSQLLGLESCDGAVSPTHWQRSLYPAAYKKDIKVIHEGVDTSLFIPDAFASLTLNGEVFRAGEPIVTFATRALEPYRGFHRFIRALPAMQAAMPEARFIIVGRETTSYGKQLPDGDTYKHYYCRELQDKVDWTRVHFSSMLPMEQYRKLLQVSAAHIYLTYPFVLSWSMLEAMSTGCLVIGSRTPPVEEVIHDRKNGLLVDFFDHDALVATVSQVINAPHQFVHIRGEARETIKQGYELTACTNSWVQYISDV